jgi:hypothetical protein
VAGKSLLEIPAQRSWQYPNPPPTFPAGPSFLRCVSFARRHSLTAIVLTMSSLASLRRAAIRAVVSASQLCVAVQAQLVSSDSIAKKVWQTTINHHQPQQQHTLFCADLASRCSFACKGLITSVGGRLWSTSSCHRPIGEFRISVCSRGEWRDSSPKPGTACQGACLRTALPTLRCFSCSSRGIDTLRPTNTVVGHIVTLLL